MTHPDLIPLIKLRRAALCNLQFAEALHMAGIRDAESAEFYRVAVTKYGLLCDAVDEVKNHLAGRSARQE